MAGFCDSVTGLQTPDFADGGTNSPKVSGHYREYSRFQETDTGDRVRSPLRGLLGEGNRVLEGARIQLNQIDQHEILSRL